MRDLREINWYQLVDAYKWFRKRGYLPEELKGHTTLGHSKKEYVELFAYVMEHFDAHRLEILPIKFTQLYNYIFMDEHEGPRSGYPSSFNFVKKVSPFGSFEGSQAYIIDMMLLEGRHTTTEIAKAIGSTESRVGSHLYSLRRKVTDYEIITAKRGRETVYYVKERKKDEKKRGEEKKNRKPSVRYFDGT